MQPSPDIWLGPVDVPDDREYRDVDAVEAPDEPPRKRTGEDADRWAVVLDAGERADGGPADSSSDDGGLSITDSVAEIDGSEIGLGHVVVGLGALYVLFGGPA